MTEKVIEFPKHKIKREIPEEVLRDRKAKADQKLADSIVSLEESASRLGDHMLETMVSEGNVPVRDAKQDTTASNGASCLSNKLMSASESIRPVRISAPLSVCIFFTISARTCPSRPGRTKHTTWWPWATSASSVASPIVPVEPSSNTRIRQHPAENFTLLHPGTLRTCQ